MSDTQKRELWDRWKAGESISEISRALGRPPGSIFTIIKSNGGIRSADPATAIRSTDFS
ncbi:helix-turn-helix domain-containing protein [Kitasatospora sp. NPDC007106]|uniref:helix-turn-helix domain-containing protein n=1 Tax=Kitasatospora sp. NPDC007106 TaxID=3156914 RepID=UPI0033E50C99